MIRSFSLLAGAAVLASTMPAPAQEADPAAIVALQFAVSGDHKGVRASGAKGVCLKGDFTPAADAASLSKAPQFAKTDSGKTVPVTARFSMGGGNPKISDKTKPTTRGFAMRMQDPAGDLTFVIISAPIFSTKTPAQLLEFLQVRAPGRTASRTRTRSRPSRRRTPRPAARRRGSTRGRCRRASRAPIYWAVHAYTLTNAKGDKTTAKLKFVAADKATLSDDELKAKPDAFYADELKDRLAKGPAKFDLVAILAEPGDPTTDVTATWPEDERKQKTLGTLAITAIAPDATCDAATFDPVVDLPEGIAGPADDPMFAIRSPAYAVSLSRRSN